MGYTGGVRDEPHYHNIADYTEALLIEFDRTVTSLETVLSEWRKQTSPYPTSCQYRTALWYLNHQQEAVMRITMENMSGGRYVDVEPATQFFRAEEYHQDFLTKQSRARELRAL